MIDLSIIIVNYNTSSITIECVQSIIKNIRQYPFEIIIVDNASKDVNLLIKTLQEKSEIRIITNSENLGFAKGLNKGIAASKGNLIMLLNSDTLLVDNSMDELIKYYYQLQGDYVVSPKLLTPENVPQLCYNPFPSLLLELIYLFRAHKYLRSTIEKKLPISFKPEAIKTFNNGYLVATCLIFRKNLLNKLRNNKLYDEMFLYGEECIWFRDFKKARVNSIYNPNFSLVHYIGMSSKNTSESDFHFQRKYNQMLGERTYLRKYYSKFYRVNFFVIRLIRLKILSLFDEEIKVRYQICLKLLKTGV